MDYKNLKERLKKNEGFSKKPYFDQLGFLTIGYGHLILKGEDNLKYKNITKKKLEKIFLNDFNNAVSDFNKFLRHIPKTKKVSELLIEMIFQLGIVNVLKFKKMLKNINNINQFLVCFEIMNSLWYKQTPLRVKKMIIIFLKT